MNKRRDIITRKELDQQGRCSNIWQERREQRRDLNKKQGILRGVTELLLSVVEILMYQMCVRMTLRGGLTAVGAALRVLRKPEKVVENPAVAEGVLIEEKQREEKNEEGKELVKVVEGVQGAVLRCGDLILWLKLKEILLIIKNFQS